MTETARSPVEEIKRKMEENGWIQADLAFFLGWRQSDVSLLLTGRKKFTIEIARDLAMVFDTSPDYWLDIHRKFELSKLDSADENIAKRAKLFKNFPIREMQKRNWIEPTENIEKLELECKKFFGINSLDEKPQLLYAARKSGSYSETTIEQAAWISRSFQLAKGVMVKKFSESALEKALEQIKLLSIDVEEIRHIPKILAEAGIRLIIIEPLPSSKIDGITLWLDKESPVIVLSIRFDRIDSFWHTLLHELAHVKNKDGQDAPIIDVDLLGEKPEDRPEIEVKADNFAAHFYIPEGKLDHFIARVHPTYSDVKIMGFAARWQVHAGIVVGQLHYKHSTTGKGLPFTHQRKFLESVRDIITQSTLTDGYGHEPLV